MMMKVSVPIEAANKAIQDGSMKKVLQEHRRPVLPRVERAGPIHAGDERPGFSGRHGEARGSLVYEAADLAPAQCTVAVAWTPHTLMPG